MLKSTRDPSVPHFPYVGIRDPPVSNNVIGKKHLSESNNRLFVDGRATVKNRPIQHFSHIFKSENRQFRLFHGILVMTSSGLLPFVDNRAQTGVWRLPKFKPQYFHLGTSIEFGDLDHPGLGRPERQTPSVKIILSRSAFRPTRRRVRPSQSQQRRPKSPSSVIDLVKLMY